METINIVIADDHLLMREGTRRILEAYPDLKVVGEADDGEKAMDLLRRLRPDLIILDIRMPKLNGVEVVQQMSDCCPDTKVLILTAYDDDEYIFALMGAGAHGYFLKTVQPTELVEAVRNIHSGEIVLDPTIAAKVAQLWAQNQMLTGRIVDKLSPRELEILRFAAKGLRNKAIADKLFISSRTVERHFSNIFIKLDVTSRMEAVLYGISQNLITLAKQS